MPAAGVLKPAQYKAVVDITGIYNNAKHHLDILEAMGVDTEGQGERLRHLASVATATLAVHEASKRD